MGREWNDRLFQRLGDSICRALEAGPLLITDMEDSDQTLIEVLSPDRKSIIGEFFIRPKRRPKKLRYRDEVVLKRDTDR